MVKISKDALAHRMARFEMLCRDAGVKITHQRMEIFRQVAKTMDHPDAETIHRRVVKRLPRVSLDTVYRALWLFRELGLIQTLDSSGGGKRFDANLVQHHHFVCRQCGLTRDFYLPALDALDISECAGDIGEIESTYLEARGICTRCKAGRKPEISKPKRRKGNNEKETD